MRVELPATVTLSGLIVAAPPPGGASQRFDFVRRNVIALNDGGAADVASISDDSAVVLRPEAIGQTVTIAFSGLAGPAAGPGVAAAASGGSGNGGGCSLPAGESTEWPGLLGLMGMVLLWVSRRKVAARR